MNFNNHIVYFNNLLVIITTKIPSYNFETVSDYSTPKFAL